MEENMLMNVEGRVVRYGIMVNGQVIEERLLALNHLPHGFDVEQDRLVSGKALVQTPIFVAGNSESGYAVQLQPGWEAKHSSSRETTDLPEVIVGPATIKLALDHRGRISVGHLPNTIILFQLVTAPPQTEEQGSRFLGWLKGFFGG
jgi:hypothetical protein